MTRKARRADGGPRLVLHIGMPKSGTTAIQKGLAAMRPELRAQGYLYPPGVATTYQHGFLIAGVRPPEQLPRIYRHIYRHAPRRAQGDLQRMLRGLERAMKESDPRTLVLSGEVFFTIVTPEERDALAVMLHRFSERIEIVAYVRRPSEYYLSGLQQALKGTDRLLPIAPVSYRAQIETLAPLATAGLHVIPYDRAGFPDGDIVAHFLQTFCPGAPTRAPAPPVNGTLSAEGMAALHDYRRIFHAGRHNVFTADAKALIQAIEAADAACGDVTRPRLRPETVAAIDQGSPDLLWLRDRFGIAFDGVDYAAIRPMRRTRIPADLAEICEIDPARRMGHMLHVVHGLLDARGRPAAPPPKP